MKKEFIIFDLADTLLELKPSPQEVIFKYILNKYCLELDKSQIRKSIICLSNIFHYSSVNIKNELSKKDFYLKFNNHLLNMLGIAHICSPDELFNQFSKKQSYWVLKRGALEVLNNLKKHHFKIGLISNFNYSEANQILSRLEIIDFFDYLHISEKEGSEKPNLDFYNRFFTKNNILKKDCLFCGDSYTLDFIPSKKIDLPFVLLDELNLFNKISNRINNISQIIDFLK